MICIFLNPLQSEFRCHAQPIRPGETGILYYKPTQNELKKYCQSSKNFCLCPRLKAFQKLKTT